MDLDAVSTRLADLLAPLDTAVVTVRGVPTTLGEVLGFVTGAACVWAVARQRLWNWPVGMANNLLFLALFTGYGLYADAGLQVVFLVLAAYGWWSWLRGGAGTDRLPVTRTTGAQWLGLLAAGVVGTALLHWLLDTQTASTVPLPDAFTTVLSLLATWGQCRKKVECWYLWIAADLVYVPLYLYKELTLTAVLYVGFLGLCVLGLRSWRADLAAATSPAAPLRVAA